MPKYLEYNMWHMQGLNKAYFNGSRRFTPLRKYGPDADHPFLYIYRHETKDHYFGVLNPISLETGGKSEPYCLNMSQLLQFINKSTAQLQDVDFLLAPVIDNKNAHWTVFQINLKEGKIHNIEHHDPSPLRKPETVRHIKTQLITTDLDQDIYKPIHHVQQLDPVNCGPFSHKIMHQLADKKPLDRLPKTGLVDRAKNSELWSKAKTISLAETNQTDLDVPFIVKHRNAIIASAVIGVLVVSTALLVLFPPAGLAGYLALAAGTLGMGLPAFATVAAGTTGLLATGGILLRQAWKTFKVNAPEKKFQYQETNDFRPYRLDQDENNLEQKPRSSEQIKEDEFEEIPRMEIVHNSPLSTNSTSHFINRGNKAKEEKTSVREKISDALTKLFKKFS